MMWSDRMLTGLQVTCAVLIFLSGKSSGDIGEPSQADQRLNNQSTTLSLRRSSWPWCQFWDAGKVTLLPDVLASLLR